MTNQTVGRAQTQWIVTSSFFLKFGWMQLLFLLLCLIHHILYNHNRIIYNLHKIVYTCTDF